MVEIINPNQNITRSSLDAQIAVSNALSRRNLIQRQLQEQREQDDLDVKWVAPFFWAFIAISCVWLSAVISAGVL